MERGIIKSFREYLNKKYPPETCGRDKNYRYHQRKRLYGDYLYNQDRDKFDWLMNEALDGLVIAQDYVDWPFYGWRKHATR